MTTIGEPISSLIGIGYFILLFLGTILYEKYAPYLSIKSRFKKQFSGNAHVRPCDPAKYEGFDAEGVRSYEQALLSHGFSKLGEGELVYAYQRYIPNVFVFFSDPATGSIALVRQIFPINLPPMPVSVSITTRVADGSRFITRSNNTYSELNLPDELCERHSGLSSDKFVETHLARLQHIEKDRLLPAPTTMQQCVDLIDARRQRQEQMISRKNPVLFAASFSRWRRARRRQN